MKRIALMMVLLIACAAAALAQSGARAKPGISIGGGTILDSYKSGGFAELGFPLYSRNGWIVRNYLSAAGYGTSTGGNGIVSFGDKITVGGTWRGGFETYAFVAGGFGLFGGSVKSFSGAPFLWSVEGGGGLQIDLSRTFAYFAELGGGGNFATSNRAIYPGPPFDTGYGSIAMGFRHFF